jgi:inner membrane protein
MEITMDTITQCLLGAATAQLGFRQRIGRDATLVAAATALLPDLDIFIAPILSLTGTENSSLSMITHHRGFSHSLGFYPVTAILVTWIWWWFRKTVLNNRQKNGNPDLETSTTDRNDRPSFWWLYGCVLVALMSHPLLDLFTSYGTQLFIPFTHKRYALDGVPIVDLIYTPILIVTLLACYIVRKIKVETRTITLIIGWTGFIVSSAYIAAGMRLHNHACEKMRQAIAAQVPSTTTQPSDDFEINAYPQLGTIFVWRVTAHNQAQWFVSRWNYLYDQPLKLSSVNEPENMWVRRAKEQPEVKIFDWFTLGQTRAGVYREDGYHIVEFFDMRYGSSPTSLDSIWSLRVVFSPMNSISAIDYVQPHRNQGLKQLAGRYWREIFTP